MIDFSRTRRRFLVLAVALAMAAGSGACRNGNGRTVGVGKGFDPSSLFDASMDDSGALDGSKTKRDGSTMGGNFIDAAVDGTVYDDGGKAEIDPSTACNVAQNYNNYSVASDLGRESGFALTTGPTGFGLGFVSMQHGELNTMPIASAGKFGTPSTALKDSFFSEDVALMWNPNGWRMAWVDNSSLMGQIETMVLSNDTLRVPTGTMRTMVTSDTLKKSRPVLADIAGVPMLAWIATDMNDTQTRVSSMRFGSSTKPVDLIPASAGHKPMTLALTRIGRTGAALAWVEEVGDHGVWLQVLDDAGKAVGKPLEVSDKTSAGNSVDLASRDDTGGAAIYSVTLGVANHEVRFQRLDAAGALFGQEIKVIGSPLQGTDASLARLGGGYVVSYRALPGGSVTKAGIRMAILTKEGNIQRDGQGRPITYPLADASAGGGRTTIRVSVDGEVLVGFLDGVGKLQLVRQRLDCGM